jgi:adenosine 3'-phospho 5'-phosphosulfate transporter B2
MSQHGTVISSAPLLYFTPCALSNTISSWSQYRALAFVSFSLQTLFKATKVIPVMLMGMVIKGTSHSMVEYIEALVITSGVAIFSMNYGNDAQAQKHTETEVTGFLLLCLYVLSDSFTSQWQSRIYRDHGKIDHYHMMFGVNLSSVILTTAAMIMSGDIPRVAEFFIYNPMAFWYNVLTAITSTTGQIAIFYTIKRFGPIVFTVIMTTRQMLSIVLSTVIFGHQISANSALGAALVFAAVFHSIFRPIKDKKALLMAAPAFFLRAISATPLAFLFPAVQHDTLKEECEELLSEKSATGTSAQHTS